VGTSIDAKNFVLAVPGLSYGSHSFVAVATDNGGRIDWSLQKGVFVNGLSVVSVKTPTPDLLIAPGSDLTLTAVATHPTGIINKLEFFANGRLLGEGSLSGPGTYTFNWKKLQRGNYSIAAIATDGSGIATVSTPVKFIVGNHVR
jgi:chitinase